MKKNGIRLLLIITILFFCSIFVSCGKTNNNSKIDTVTNVTTKTNELTTKDTEEDKEDDDCELIFDKSKYEICVGDNYSLNPTVVGKIKQTEYTVEDNTIISVSDKGIITALKEGNSNLYVIVNGNPSSLITLNIIVKPKTPHVEVGNVEENQKIYNNLLQDLANFSSKIDNSNYLTYINKTDINGLKGGYTIKTINEPVYLEVMNNLSPYPSIILEEDGKIFEYTFDNETSIKKRYLKSKEDFIATDDIDTETLLDFCFNPEKGNAKKVGDAYTFIAYYKDALDEVSKEIIEEVYKSLGISTSKLYDSIVEITITVKDDQIIISNTLNFELDVNDTTIKYNMVISYDVSIKEFSKIDFSDPKYTISKPTCFEEVTKLTDLSKPYSLKKFSTDYIKVSLEKGQYFISGSYNDYFNFYIEFYDLDSNPVNMSFNKSLFNSSWRTSYTFVVPETNEYYIKLKNGISSDKILVFNKIDYESTFDINQPKGLTEINNGRIEGEWDFEYYEYIASETGIIRIKNTGENAVYLIFNQYGGGNSIYLIQKDENVYAKVEKGANNFIVCNTIWDNAPAYDYSFSIERIENNNGSETDYEKMDIITDTYSDKYYMTGFGLDDKNLKLIVNERGLYGFDFEFLESGMGFNVSVIKETGETIYNDGSYEFILEPGNYIVRITNNEHIFGIGKIKYIYYDISDKRVDVVLFKRDLANIGEPGFFNLINQKIITSQVIKYYFTLTEDSTVVYDENYFIYDSEDKLISLSPDYTGDKYYGLIDLKAGNYYFTTPSMHGKLDHPLKVAIVEQYRDTKQDLHNLTELKVGETVNVKKDWSYDKEYFQINITEEGNYLLSSGIYDLYDENFNFIQTKYINGTYQFELEVGKYYLIYIYKVFETVLNISLTKAY